MPNAKDLSISPTESILAVGPTGSGKTVQITTLPGRKFVYIFDPNALASLRGADVEYELFLPDPLEMDVTIKAFNKDARPDDKALASLIEPRTYMNWIEDVNERYDNGFFKDIDWLCIDSLTYLSRTCMDRNLWVNRRYGKLEDLADYRIVGSKIVSAFRSIFSSGTSLYCTVHYQTFQDEKTKKIETQLSLPGSARSMLPTGFNNVWETLYDLKDDKEKYLIRTRPDPRGLKTIRNTIRGLETLEDVTIADFNHPEKYGIGAILTRQ